MVQDSYVFDELGEVDCRRLLELVSIGRLGYTQGALPQIRPVHFAVCGDEIAVGSIGSDKYALAGRGDVVVFEADSYNPQTGEGWCVSVIGPARAIIDPADIDALDALGFAPWTAEQGRHYFAIPMTVIHGRRLSRQHAGALIKP